MNSKSRTLVGIVTASVLSAAGIATMANAVASAQPAAPAVSVQAPTPTASPSGLPDDHQRADQLGRSVDDLVTQIGALEQAVAAGTPTPTAGPTSPSGRVGGTDDVTPEVELEHATAPAAVAAVEDRSDIPEVEAPEVEAHGSGSDESGSHESRDASDD